ncbi:hypothetical protein PENTCL1PPCAC_28496, partial [Pristionchus entomophagus]
VVDLNANGLSIESPGKLLRGKSWSSRYFVCKKQCDLSSPIFIIYKNASRRRSSHYKYQVSLQSYLGIECSFELQKQSHTLAVLTKEQVLILAFAEVKNVIIWESWIRNACGQSQCFYMQLLSAPKGSRAESCKEVRLHLHNSHLSIIHGRPQEIVLCVSLFDIRIFSRTPIKFSFATSALESNSNCYALKCARLDIFYKLLEKAMSRSGLQLYLNRTAGTEGEWIGKRINEESQPKKKVASRTHSESFNAVFNAKPNGNLSSHYFDNEKSKSGMLYASELPAVDKICRTMSLASYKAFQEMPRFIVLNRGVSRDSSFRSNAEIEEDIEIDYRRTSPERHAWESQDEASSVASNRNYANISRYEMNKMPGLVRSRSKMSLASDRSGPIDERGGRRRSDNSVTSNTHSSFIKRRNNLSKQRSMMEFTDRGEDLMERYENWKRAKNFISSFTPRTTVSQSDLLAKSSSTGALAVAQSVLHKRSEQSLHPNWHPAMDEMSSSEHLPPPHLNESVNQKMNYDEQGSHRDEKPRIAGLVRPGADYVLSARSGVGALLAKRLASSIKGSFSKYDGDKTTHSYHVNPVKEDSEAERREAEMDPIMAKMRDMKIKETQRQAEEAKRVTQITVVKRDRSPSPPLEDAPTLPRHESTSTLINRSPSRESVSSDKTPTRDPTPPPLPQRTYKRKETSSGSSHGSPVAHKTFDYCEVYQTIKKSGSAHQLTDDLNYVVIDAGGTLAIKNANQSGLNRELSKSTTFHPRKISASEQSTNSDNLSVNSAQPTSRQGFFRKYRKMRRDRKTAVSMTNLNLT